MEEKLLYRKPCLYIGDFLKLACADGSAASGTMATGTSCTQGDLADIGDCADGADNAVGQNEPCHNGSGDSNNWDQYCTDGSVASDGTSACQTGNRVVVD